MFHIRRAATHILLVLLTATTLLHLLSLKPVAATTAAVGSVNEQVIDLIEMAPRAAWVSTAGELVFGRDQYEVTLAAYRYHVQMPNKHIYPKTIYTPVATADYPTTVRGHYRLRLPRAGKIVFLAESCGNPSAYHRMAIGYLLREKSNEVVSFKEVQLFQTPGGVDEGSAVFQADITFLAGKEVELVLKTQAQATTSVGQLYWTKAQVISYYPRSKGFDLSCSPSDIDIVPQTNPYAAKLKFTIRNMGLDNSPPYALMLKGGNTNKTIARISGRSIAAGGVGTLEYLMVSKDRQKHEFTFVCRAEADGSEQVIENNDAYFTVRIPYLGLNLRRIEGIPRPWKAESLKVVFNNQLHSVEGYSLTYNIIDWLGKTVQTDKEVKLPSGDTFSVLEFPLPRQVASRPGPGWFRATFTLEYRGTQIDSHAINVSRMPERPAVLSKIMGIGFASLGIRGAIDLELIKDMGARYVRHSNPQYEKALVAQGNGEYLISYVANENLTAIVSQGWSPSLEQKIYDETYNLVNQNKGLVKIYEQGNEWNLGISTEDAGRLYRIIYAAAKHADADCIINTGGAGGGGAAVVEWHRKLYRSYRDSIDNISLHSYCFSHPDFNDNLMRYCNQPVEDYLQILESFGDYPRKNIFISEYGYFANGQRNIELSALWSVRQFLIGARYNIPMLQFLLFDVGYDPMNEGGCTIGLVYFNGEPKLAYVAYAVLANKLGGADFVTEKDIGKNNYLYQFNKDGKSFVYLWKAQGADEMIVVPAAGKEVLIMDIMGGIRSAASSAGAVSIPLSTAPHYVEGIELANFRLLGRYSASRARLEKMKNGAKLYHHVKNASTTSAWVWWEICKRQWRESSSLTVIRELFERVEKAISSSPHLHEEHISSDKLVECRYRAGIKIDGKLDEWGGLPVYQGKNVIPGDSLTPVVKGENDLSYTFRTAWDATHFYIGLDVRDDNVHSSQTELNLWTEDCVEIWLGSLNDKSETRQEDDFHYLFGVNNISYAVAFFGPITSSSYFVVKKKPGGYTMEIAIPLDELMLSHLKEGYTIGFEVGVDDSDEALGRDAQVLAFGNSEMVWSNPSLWGNLRFVK